MLKALSYPRSLLMALIYPFFLMALSAGALFCTYFSASKKLSSAVVYFWGKATCWMFGVHLKIVGQENIPSGACVYLFNHTSFFDIFAISWILPNIYFGGKAELFNIPLFGRVGHRFGFLPIPRENRERAIEILHNAEERFQRGDQFALAPEGTRMNQEKIGPFKSGPFIFAINGQVPVVPVIIRGAHSILGKAQLVPNWGFWKSEIEVIFEKPITTAGLTLDQRNDLKENVRDVMLRYLPDGINNAY